MIAIVIMLITLLIIISIIVIVILTRIDDDENEFMMPKGPICKMFYICWTWLLQTLGFYIVQIRISWQAQRKVAHPVP